MASHSNTACEGRTRVGLVMKEGIMYTASPNSDVEAKGIALADADQGEDLAL